MAAHPRRPPRRHPRHEGHPPRWAALQAHAHLAPLFGCGGHATAIVQLRTSQTLPLAPPIMEGQVQACLIIITIIQARSCLFTLPTTLSGEPVEVVSSGGRAAAGEQPTGEQPASAAEEPPAAQDPPAAGAQGSPGSGDSAANDDDDEPPPPEAFGGCKPSRLQHPCCRMTPLEAGLLPCDQPWVFGPARAYLFTMWRC